MKAVVLSLFAALFVLAGVPAQASVFSKDGVTIAGSEDSRTETATPTKTAADPADEEKKPEEKKPD